MESRHGVATRGDEKKPVWRSPRLEEIGNLRNFVREGHAFGKSGVGFDGGTSGSDEAMPQMND